MRSLEEKEKEEKEEKEKEKVREVMFDALSKPLKSLVGKVSGEVRTESIRNVLQDIYKINYGIEASVAVDPIDPNQFHITSKIINNTIVFNMGT